MSEPVRAVGVLRHSSVVTSLHREDPKLDES